MGDGIRDTTDPTQGSRRQDMSDNAVISVKNLKTYFYTNERCNRAINGVSMDIKKRQDTL